MNNTRVNTHKQLLEPNHAYTMLLERLNKTDKSRNNKTAEFSETAEQRQQAD